MKTTATLVTAVAFSLLAQSSAAPAAPEPASTMEQCAKLLPPGRHYTFGVTGQSTTPAQHPSCTVNCHLRTTRTTISTRPAAPFAHISPSSCAERAWGAQGS